MKMQFRRAVALAALLSGSVSTAAQSPTPAPSPTGSQAQIELGNPTEPQTQETLVRDALARYQAGLDAIKNGAAGTAMSIANQVAISRPIRELRLSEVVALALEKNLDIAVERLNPQAIDFQIAGLRNAYQPLATSTIGQRDNTQLPRDQLQGGQRVAVATTTYNAAISQQLPWWGGDFLVTFNNNRQDSSSNFVTFNPTYTTGLTATYTQPLLRGLFMDQTRQQLAITQINRDISEENVRATVTQTLANVRNAYWDLVFARSAVDVAQRALALADKFVERHLAGQRVRRQAQC
ncbi:MAG TPA: TolC family protein [Vicinamibacterales bacterium]|nr:TolC family protein [Vicinamibacterales bacterium]